MHFFLLKCTYVLTAYLDFIFVATVNLIYFLCRTSCLFQWIYLLEAIILIISFTYHSWLYWLKNAINATDVISYTVFKIPPHEEQFKIQIWKLCGRCVIVRNESCYRLIYSIMLQLTTLSIYCPFNWPIIFPKLSSGNSVSDTQHCASVFSLPMPNQVYWWSISICKDTCSHFSLKYNLCLETRLVILRHLLPII